MTAPPVFQDRQLAAVHLFSWFSSLPADGRTGRSGRSGEDTSSRVRSQVGVQQVTQLISGRFQRRRPSCDEGGFCTVTFGHAQPTFVFHRFRCTKPRLRGVVSSLGTGRVHTVVTSASACQTRTTPLKQALIFVFRLVFASITDENSSILCECSNPH